MGKMNNKDKLIFIHTKPEELYQVYFHMRVDPLTDIENRRRDELRYEILNTLASLDENTTKKD